MTDDFVRIDLHVHTPASLEDYGDASDDQYYSILQNAKERDIEIIALTDHNSIEGYRTMTSLRERLLFEQESLSAITDSQQAAQKLLQIQARLSLFEGISILPGVELTVRPGIHMLILFNPSLGLPPIEEFLAEAGYEPGGLSSTQPAFAKWDVVTLLENSGAYDCIVLDAHTDSDKGIWNELSGAYRMDCLRSEQLSGLCYKSEVQRDKISALLSSPQYARARPLAFLRFSDAHTPTDVGSIFTWARLDNLSFESLRRAFVSPLQSFSTEEPSTTRILSRLKDLSNSFGIAKLESPDDTQRLQKLASALNNSEGGYILLGVTETKNTVGILRDTENLIANQIEHILRKVFSLLTELEPFLSIQRPQVQPYELLSKRFILSLYFSKGTSLVNIKDDPSIYSVRKGRVVSLSASEIESLVQDNLLKDVHAKIVSRLQAVEDDCLQIKNLTVSLPLMRKFEMNSFSIEATPILPRAVPLNYSQVQRLLKFPHPIGCARGNLLYVDNTVPARLDCAYLRHTLPLRSVQHPLPKARLRETIYILPTGAIYYSKYDYPFYSSRSQLILKLYSEGLTSLHGIRFAVSFLKSSFHLWYLQNRHGTTDCTHPEVFRVLRLPIIKQSRPDSKKELAFINHTFDDIIKEERSFIAELNKSYITKTADVRIKFIDDYNARIAQRFYAIDQSIYKLLGLSDNEIDVVENNLTFNKIFLPTRIDPSPSPSQ